MSRRIPLVHVLAFCLLAGSGALAVPVALAASTARIGAGMRRAQVGVHYAKIAHPCAAPAPGHAGCLVLDRVPAAAETRGAQKYVVHAAYDVGPAGGYTPKDLWTAYGLGTATTLTAPGGPGSTQTVGIVDAFDTPTVEADLQTFDAEYGLPACNTLNGCFTKVAQDGSASLPPAAGGNGWDKETALDVEAVHAVCPDCKILLVEATSNAMSNLAAAVSTAVTLGATEVTNSYGSGEIATNEAQYAHSGVVMTAAAGDNGYFNWDDSSMAQKAQVPAAFPEVTAVGGTTLRLNADGTRSSERVWNDDTGPQAGTLAGGSGGGCSALFTAQPWQSAVSGYTAAGCSGHRLDSDVAALGDPLTGFDVYDSYTGSGSAPGWITAGGTSLSSPIIASVYALAGGGQSVANPTATLYAGAAAAPGALYDVTVGGNGYCDGASTCSGIPSSTADCGGTSACHAESGFDGPSGLGTPNGLVAFAPVIASFTLPATAGAGSVPVDASASSSSADPITTYAWDWGDGHTSTTTTPTTSHIFTAGVYTVTLTASTAAGVTSVPRTAKIAVDTPVPASSGPPAITGTPSSLGTLTEGHAAWTGSPTGYTYQWQRCDSAGSSCAPIAGATRQTYSLLDADVGHTLVVSETAENAAGASAAATSAPSAVIGAAPAPDLTPFGITPGSPFTSAKDPSAVAFSPDGSLLAVTNQLDNSISMFSVGSQGVLTAVGSPFSLGAAGDVASGVAFSHDAKRLAVAAAPGLEILGVSATGVLSHVATLKTRVHEDPGFGPGILTFSPDDSLLAVADTDYSSVSIYHVADNGGLSEAQGSPVTGLPLDYSVAFDPSGRFLAAPISDEDQVMVYAVAGDGALTPVTGSPFATTSAPTTVSFSGGGRWLAVGGNSLSMFSVGSDGALTPVAGSPFARGPMAQLGFSRNGLLGIFDGDAVEADSISSAGVPTTIGKALHPFAPLPVDGVRPGMAFNAAGSMIAVTQPQSQHVGVVAQGAPVPPPATPIVTTGDATSVTATSALLHGTVDPNDHATTYAFVYGTTTAYGQQASPGSYGATTGPLNASAFVGSLQPATTYHYAITATNSEGTATSDDRTFTTAAQPVTTTTGGTLPASTTPTATKPPATTPPATVSASQIGAALAGLGAPKGKRSRIAKVLRAGGYSYSFACPGAGVLALRWVTTAHHPALIAKGSVTCTSAGARTVRVRVTTKGRRLLKHAHKSAKLRSAATFTTARQATAHKTKAFTLRR